MSPQISIIIPTYRRLAKLERALQSVQFGCHSSYEVIVIDDCPEGSAAPIAVRHRAKYVFKAGENAGQSSSRNIGIQLAEGRAIVFLDDDDFFVQNGVDALYSALNGKCLIAFGNHSILESGSLVTRDLSRVLYDHLLICNHIPVGSFIVEKSAIRRNFDATMRSHEDWDFLLYHMAKCEWKHVSQVVVTIDKTENKTTSTEARRRKHFWADFVSVYSRYPAPQLAQSRCKMMQNLGLELDPGLFMYKEER
jgi:glycosyltransferase involved in cell wall biosynthesis